ncbi:hypothetical protein [Streptomyces sp. ACT015]|uniref:hypothetical protein n=1 Tax=Streptomyces sp. ACT015 TaxID=3134807 RepID=UPI003D178903
MPSVIKTTAGIARLHGECCRDRGTTDRPLQTAGAVRVTGSDRERPVATCGCRPRRSPAPR